jgi:hypothetical protein
MANDDEITPEEQADIDRLEALEAKRAKLKAKKEAASSGQSGQISGMSEATGQAILAELKKQNEGTGTKKKGGLFGGGK